MKLNKNLFKIINRVPLEQYNELSISLMDILLTSSEGEKISGSLIKDLLNIWRKNELDTSEGLNILFNAVLSISLEEIRNLLNSKGFDYRFLTIDAEGRGGDVIRGHKILKSHKGSWEFV